MKSVERIQGRDLCESDIEQVRALIASHPHWHRTRLSVELAQTWNWRSAAGQLQDMAARSLLRKLEHRGWITLPPRRHEFYPRLPLNSASPELPLVSEPIAEPLAGLLPVHLELVVAGHRDRALFSRYLACYHYLGYRGPVGESIGYVARDCHGRDLACVLFGAAAWKTRPRDAWIGWDDATRARRLLHITNNTRFLILPWVRVPHLASHLLGCITRRLAADWQTRYGHAVHLVETFVDSERFRGTCYRAANWTHVGQTQGRGRQDRDHVLRVPVKDVYLYPLTRDFRHRLCHE